MKPKQRNDEDSLLLHVLELLIDNQGRRADAEVMNVMMLVSVEGDDHYLSIPGPRFVLPGSVLPSPAHYSKYGNNNSTHHSSHNNTWSDSKQQQRCQNICDNILQLARVCLLMLEFQSSVPSMSIQRLNLCLVEDKR